MNHFFSRFSRDRESRQCLTPVLLKHPPFMKEGIKETKPPALFLRNALHWQKWLDLSSVRSGTVQTCQAIHVCQIAGSGGPSSQLIHQRHFHTWASPQILDESRKSAQDHRAQHQGTRVEVSFHQVGERVQGQSEDSLDTTVIRLEVGIGRVGVESPQHRTVAMAAKNSDSFQNLCRCSEGELFTDFHTPAYKSSSPCRSISIKAQVLLKSVF